MTVKIYIKCLIRSFTNSTTLESLGPTSIWDSKRLSNFPQFTAHSARIQIQVGLVPKLFISFLSLPSSCSPQFLPCSTHTRVHTHILPRQISIKWSVISLVPKAWGCLSNTAMTQLTLHWGCFYTSGHFAPDSHSVLTPAPVWEAVHCTCFVVESAATGGRQWKASVFLSISGACDESCGQCKHRGEGAR